MGSRSLRLIKNLKKPLKRGPVVVLLGVGVLGCHFSTVPGDVFDTGKGWRNDQSMNKVTRWIVLACTTSAEGFCSWRFFVFGFVERRRDHGAANEWNPCLGF